MRSLLITTDFIYREDGTLTPTEINTDSSHSLSLVVKGFGADAFLPNFGNYFDHVNFHQFLVNGGFNKILTIDKKGGTHRIFESFCAYYNIQYEFVEVTPSSITIPEVEDNETTLIVRIAYDTYAIVDDLYARDMYEFHNLIKNESFASPVNFTSENLDTIENFEPSQDGVIPNYVVKPRVPGYNKYEYPKLYRLDSTEELDNLKQTVRTDEFVQKYEYNPSKLVSNRTSFIRSFDLICSPDLTIVHIMSYKSMNLMSTQNTLLRFDNEIDPLNKKLDNLFATKWWPSKYVEHGLMYHFDQNDEIVLEDGTLVTGADIKEGDSVKTFFVTEYLMGRETGLVSELDDFIIDSTIIRSKTPDDNTGVFVNIEAVDSEGRTFRWFDGMSNLYLTTKQGTDTVSYESANSSKLGVGDLIYTYNKENNSVESLTVTEIYFDLKPTLDIYSMTLEKTHQFFVKFDSDAGDKSLYLIQHNQNCAGGCGMWYTCSTWAGYYCGNGSFNCPNCGGFSGYVCNSDIRYKRNIKEFGTSKSGIKIYDFEYKDQPGNIYRGVIAQELIGTKFQKALLRNLDGLYSVDYSKIDVEFLKIN